jgi:transposase
MAEDPMAKDPLREEFDKLGGNLRSVIQGAWESEERKQVSNEVQSGLSQVGDAIAQAAKDLSEDPTAQKLRQEVDEIAERVRTGELAEKVRVELIDVLQQVNERLAELSANFEQALSNTDDSDIEEP